MNELLFWSIIIFTFFLGFFVGWLKFVPDSPEIIKKELLKFRKTVAEKTDITEVGPIRHLKGEELDRSQHPEKYAGEHETEETIRKQLIDGNYPPQGST